ncbi:MAG: hypothetical protein ACI8P9_003156 [Parasphingorhabdus sp.]|jgi:hypothetical protein
MQLENSNSYIRLDGTNSRRHLAAIIVVLMVIIGLELTLGKSHDSQRTENIASKSDNWAIADYRAGNGQLLVPPKPHGLKRIAYISNSHAKTGGMVARHLADLLKAIAPGEFEVLDMAEPGIFAPDMLQRSLRGLDYDLDLVVLGLSYITFSDRMNLALQAHTARAFFNRGIFERLPTGFWMRNWDIGLYTNALFARLSALYRNRNELRNTWEQPLAAQLKGLTGIAAPVLFLEVDSNQRWRFPQGYDNNLFQWHLYASGRDGHLKDLRVLTETLHQANMPLVAFNIPIDFGKSTHPFDPADYLLYREQVAEAMADSKDFVDLETYFPVEFSTYDALHPTWQGARLHALDIVIRMAWQGQLHIESPQWLLQKYLASDPPVSEAYRKALSGSLSARDSRSFRRFELGEPDNARSLLQRLNGLVLGSQKEQRFLKALSLRTRFWLEKEFFVSTSTPTHGEFAAVWNAAVKKEVNGARQRIEYFLNRLNEVQSRRLTNFPVPETNQATFLGDRLEEGTIDLVWSTFREADGRQVILAKTAADQEVAWLITPHAGKPGYQRIDLFGDGSFLQIIPWGVPIELPYWVVFVEPEVRWGI